MPVDGEMESGLDGVSQASASSKEIDPRRRVDQNDRRVVSSSSAKWTLP
jgi:hypothetical protein